MNANGGVGNGAFDLQGHLVNINATGADINIESRDDVWIKAGTAADSSYGTNGDIGVHAGRHLYLRAGDGGSMTSNTAGIIIGDSNNLRWSEVIEPLKVFDSTQAGVNSALSDAAGDNLEDFTIKADSASAITTRTANGTLAYCRTTAFGANGLICKVGGRNLNISSPPQKMEFMAGLKARTHTLAITHQTVKPSSKVKYHFSTRAPTAWGGLSLTSYGTAPTMTFTTSPFPLLIQGYTIRPFTTYANNPIVNASSSTPSGSATVSFEIWIATRPAAYFVDYVTSNGWFSTNCVDDVPDTNLDYIRQNTEIASATQVCKKLSANQRTVTNSNSVYNAWTSSSTSMDTEPVSNKLTTQFIIPADTPYHVFFVERLVTSNTGIYPTVNFLGTASLGLDGNGAGQNHDAAAIGIDVWYTALNEI